MNMIPRLRTGSALCVLGLATLSVSADDLLLAVIEFDGLPAGVRLLDPTTGAMMGDFVAPDFPNNGMLQQVEAISAGPDRTVLFGQPGGNGAIHQYDENGVFIGVYLGGTPDPNPVDNIRSMTISNDGTFLFTSDWDDSNDIHKFNLSDGSTATGDALGVLIQGSQSAPELGQPQAIAMTITGNLLVGDLHRRQIVEYNPNTGNRIGAFSALDFTASFQDIDTFIDGGVVVTENGSGDRIRRLDSSGALIEEFTFSNPDGVHLLPDGSYLVGSGSTSGQGKGLFRVSSTGAILDVIDSSRSYGAIELVTLTYTPCIADINGDGTLNFFDISAFLSAFSAGDLSVDFTGDGNLNFFDVSLFLSAFSAGCP